MTTQARTVAQQTHVETHAPYLTLFFVLLNYTAMEYVYAKFHTWSLLPVLLIGTAGLLTILTAVVASVYKLHFNRNWVYLTMVPAVFLGVTPTPLIAGLMILAVTKATLVGMWFMHLKFEGNWIYLMLVPAGILATVLILGLLPDMTMQPTIEEQEAQEEELAFQGRILPPAPYDLLTCQIRTVAS